MEPQAYHAQEPNTCSAMPVRVERPIQLIKHVTSAVQPYSGAALVGLHPF